MLSGTTVSSDCIILRVKQSIRLLSNIEVVYKQEEELNRNELETHGKHDVRHVRRDKCDRYNIQGVKQINPTMKETRSKNKKCVKIRMLRIISQINTGIVFISLTEIRSQMGSTSCTIATRKGNPIPMVSRICLHKKEATIARKQTAIVFCPYKPCAVL